MITYKSNIGRIRLVLEPTEFKKVKIKSSKDAEEYARQFFYDDIQLYESAFAIFLNQSNNIIGYVKLSKGGITGTVMDPMIVAKYAIEILAKNVILLHNHPSGNLQPSRDDIEVTAKIKNGLRLFDCNLSDHIILTAEGYYSFCDEGIL